MGGYKMKSPILALLAALIVFVVADACLAQGGVAFGRSDSPFGPTTSPYLNLLQNNDPFNQVSSYNTLVRPLVDQNNALQRQNNSINRLQQQVNSGASGAGAGGTRSTGSTGHSSFFMNYSHYFGRPR
jgi:hypothetical protein